MKRTVMAVGRARAKAARVRGLIVGEGSGDSERIAG